MRSKLEAFKKFAQMFYGAISMEILPWTKARVSNPGAVEGMNNKIKSISHRCSSFRTAEFHRGASTTAVLSCHYPLRRYYTLGRGTPPWIAAIAL